MQVAHLVQTSLFLRSKAQQLISATSVGMDR